MTQIIKSHVKDPGSAITHFIGMLMAIFAAVPLLIKAAHEPGRILYYIHSSICSKPYFAICSKHHISYL